MGDNWYGRDARCENGLRGNSPPRPYEFGGIGEKGKKERGEQRKEERKKNNKRKERNEGKIERKGERKERKGEDEGKSSFLLAFPAL